jgi:NDP-sugar pyrophosphorylase family protein
MRPYTDDRPKAMVTVAGMPIIEHQIRWLVKNSVSNVVVSCGYRAEVIQDFLGNGSRFGADVRYAVEEFALGRGGGLKLGAAHLTHPGERWFGMNGDVIARFSLAQMLDHHRESDAMATVALAPFRTSWGIVDLEGGLITGFRQSPVLPYWINGGIYLMEPDCVDLLPDVGDHEDTTFPELARQRQLAGFPIAGYWRGIDTVKDVIEAGEELKKLG